MTGQSVITPWREKFQPITLLSRKRGFITHYAHKKMAQFRITPHKKRLMLLRQPITHPLFKETTQISICKMKEVLQAPFPTDWRNNKKRHIVMSKFSTKIFSVHRRARFLPETNRFLLYHTFTNSGVSRPRYLVSPKALNTEVEMILPWQWRIAFCTSCFPFLSCSADVFAVGWADSSDRFWSSWNKASKDWCGPPKKNTTRSQKFEKSNIQQVKNSRSQEFMRSRI